MNENEVATIIVNAAYTIHQRLGPGLMESVYESTLAYELANVD
jgi:GxxExxY protein